MLQTIGSKTLIMYCPHCKYMISDCVCKRNVALAKPQTEKRITVEIKRAMLFVSPICNPFFKQM